MLAHVADEVQETVILHPVVVVHELCLVRRVRLEIQEFGQLFLYAGDVMVQCFLIQKVSLL